MNGRSARKGVVMISQNPDSHRIVITGVGLTSPIGNNLAEFRAGLRLVAVGLSEFDVRYFGTRCRRVPVR